MLTFQLAETNLQGQNPSSKFSQSQNLSGVLTRKDQKVLMLYIDQQVSSEQISNEDADSFKKRMDNEKIT